MRRDISRDKPVEEEMRRTARTQADPGPGELSFATEPSAERRRIGPSFGERRRRPRQAGPAAPPLIAIRAGGATIADLKKKMASGESSRSLTQMYLVRIGSWTGTGLRSVRKRIPDGHRGMLHEKGGIAERPERHQDEHGRGPVRASRSPRGRSRPPTRHRREAARRPG
jgi:hypothetical protein